MGLFWHIRIAVCMLLPDSMPAHETWANINLDGRNTQKALDSCVMRPATRRPATRHAALLVSTTGPGHK